MPQLIAQRMTSEQILELTKYREGMSSEDLEKVLKERFNPPFTRDNMASQLAKRLCPILEIKRGVPKI